MLRKLLAAAVTAAALLVLAPPAEAAVGSPTPPPPHRQRGPVASAYPFPLCVTTTWRAKHTQRPKTRPGATCLLTEDMWLPRSWRILGVWASGVWSDEDRFVALVVQRPRVGR